MPIVWIYPYAMEVRQAWSTGSCIGGFADIRDILRYVCLSTSTLKGMDPFNVITHGKSGWPEDSLRHGLYPPAPGATHTYMHCCCHCCMHVEFHLMSKVIQRYVDTSIVKPEGKSGWPEGVCGTWCCVPRHLVCVQSHRGMAYIHQYHVPHTPTCTAVAKGMFTATQRYKVSRPMGMYANLSTVRAKVSQGGLEVAVTCSIFTSTRCHTLACVFAATAMGMWYLT
ncbi:hypothetical protein K439DRAFT_1616012 [Ramaria rubella]|nr:hypothetical protein K439DRAFT_1616012 [Ramaria rubella]